MPRTARRSAHALLAAVVLAAGVWGAGSARRLQRAFSPPVVRWARLKSWRHLPDKWSIHSLLADAASLPASIHSGRGAAGAAILNAELMHREGLL